VAPGNPALANAVTLGLSVNTAAFNATTGATSEMQLVRRLFTEARRVELGFLPSVKQGQLKPDSDRCLPPYSSPGRSASPH
jgi:hypothetical protein